MSWSKVSYNQGDGIIEIIVRTDTGAKLDKLVANQSDKKQHKKIGRILRDKYGIDLTPEESMFEF